MRRGTFLSAGLAAAVLGAAGFALLFGPRDRGTPPAGHPTPARATHSTPDGHHPGGNAADRPPGPSGQTPAPPTLLPVASSADRLHAPGSDPGEDLEILENLIQTYRKHHGGNPTGENEEIVRTLSGGNAKHLVYLPGTHPAIDARGRLLDRWGTPFFFHALSSRDMEIRSAGPDRQFGTPDDTLLGAPPEP